jgi:hypothetical protein
MDLINPFEPFGKAATWPPQSSTRLRALVPTGAHVGHANDLSVTHNSRGGGGRATALEVYHGHRGKTAAKYRGVSKALPRFRATGSFTRGEKMATAATYGSKGDTQVVFKKPERARQNRAAVERGVQMAAGTYKAPRKPMFADLATRYGAPGPVGKGMRFGDASSRGTRF